MTVSPNHISVGDLFYISIEVINGDGVPSQPESVPGANINYFGLTGNSSSFTSINGQTSRQTKQIWTLTLRAKKEGSYSFGPISAGHVKSNVVKYTIGKAHPAPGNSQPGVGSNNNSDSDDDSKPRFIGHGDQNLFLKASVNKTICFEQEALEYVVKLYTNYSAVKFIGATSSPKFDGFVVEESKDVSSSLSYETLNGKSYATAVIARYIIFPQMTGKLKVTGNKYTISVDRREYYHDPFFGGIGYNTPLQLNVTPNDLTIDVQSLPEPRPTDFSGGVGDFKISSTLKGNDFKTNQTASIIYTISGSGNIKYIQMPELSSLFPPQLEVYTPTSTQNVNVGSRSVSGSVQFDYSFMPLEEGTYKIPEVKFVYFNPSTKRYESSIAKGYEINVGKGKSSSKSQVRKQVRLNPTLQRIEPNKLFKIKNYYVASFPYWLWYIVPTVLLIVFIICYHIYLRQHKDMLSFNSRRADKLARRWLRKASQALKKNDKELYYTVLLKALWGYLGDKLKMPTSELMRDNVRQVLSAKGVDDNCIEEFINLIDNVEFARYSSGDNNLSMEELYRSSIGVINEMETSFKKIRHD